MNTINFVGLTDKEIELLHRMLDDRLQTCDIADEWNLNMNLFIKIDNFYKQIKEDNKQ